MDEHYIRGENGTRGLGSTVNSKYRWFVERITTEMAKHYGQNDNVVGVITSYSIHYTKLYDIAMGQKSGGLWET